MTNEKNRADATRAKEILSGDQAKATGNQPSAVKASSAGFDTSQYQAGKESMLGEAKDIASSVAGSVSYSIDKVRDTASDTLQEVGARVRDGYGSAAERAGDTYASGARVSRRSARHGRDGFLRASDRTVDFFEDYPLMLGAVGFAGGLLLGALLPRTKSEDRHLGRWRDELGDDGARYGREAVSQARQYAVDTLRDARVRAEEEMRRTAFGS